MKLFLIRHAHSVANNMKLVTGDKSDPLHEIGISQSLEAAKWIKSLIDVDEVDLFVTSDWRRAIQTAEILIPEAIWTIQPAVGETDAGSVKNLPLNDFYRLEPNFYDSNDNQYPDGESHIELNNRVMLWLDELVQTYQGKTVVAVVHSGPISCILQDVCHVSMQHFPVFLALNCSVSRIDFTIDFDKGVCPKLKYFSTGFNKALNEDC